jgi:cytoskeleton protein RodZ
VRSYARYLGLDSVAYVERFKRDISGRAEEQSREPAPIHQDEARRLPNGWRVIAAAVVILLVWGAWRLLSSGGESNQPVPPAPALNPPKPVSAAPKPAAAVASSQTPAPPPPADAATSQQAVAIPPPAAGAKTPETSLAPAGSSATPPVAETTEPQAAVPAVGGAGNGTGTVYGAFNQNSRVVLRARGQTRITVRGPDGQTYLNRDLKAGDSYLVPNIVGLTLATNDAGQLEIDLDGVALGRAGQPEQIVGRVSLDPQSLADRFNNH